MHHAKKKPKFVRVKNNTRAEHVGCSQKYFDAHLKDQDLRVNYQTTTFYGVTDPNGEEWNIDGDHVLDPAKTAVHNTVGHELTFGRGGVS